MGGSIAFFSKATQSIFLKKLCFLISFPFSLFAGFKGKKAGKIYSLLRFSVLNPLLNPLHPVKNDPGSLFDNVE